MAIDKGSGVQSIGAVLDFYEETPVPVLKIRSRSSSVLDNLD
jgi:hypothetical protein